MYAFLESVFSDGEIDPMIDALEAVPGSRGQVSDGLDEDFRRVTSREFGDGFELISATLGEAVNAANDEVFGFDVGGTVEELAFLSYEVPGDHYVDHLDVHLDDLNTERSNRKLSFVVQLSDPGDYEGCDLVLLGGSLDGEPMPRERGAMIVFPSWLTHRVTPLASGRRRAIVGWMHGPAWR